LLLLPVVQRQNEINQIFKGLRQGCLVQKNLLKKRDALSEPQKKRVDKILKMIDKKKFSG
jgi:hypothetical protein